MLLKAVARTFIALVVLLLLFWLVSSWLAKSLLNHYLAPYQLAVSAKSQIHINPFVFSLSIKDFALLHQQSKLISIQKLETDIAPLQYWLANTIQIKQLKVTGLTADIARTKGGGLLLGGVDLMALFSGASGLPQASDADQSKLTDNKAEQIIMRLGTVQFEHFALHIQQQGLTVNALLERLLVEHLVMENDIAHFAIRLALSFDAQLANQAEHSSLITKLEATTKGQLALAPRLTLSLNEYMLKAVDTEAMVAGYAITNNKLVLNGTQFNADLAQAEPQLTTQFNVALDRLATKPQGMKATTLQVGRVGLSNAQLTYGQARRGPQLAAEQLQINAINAMQEQEDKPPLLALSRVQVDDLLLSKNAVAIEQILLGKLDAVLALNADKELQPLYLAAPAPLAEYMMVEANRQTNDITDAEGVIPSLVANQASMAISLAKLALLEPVDIYFKDNSVKPIFASHIVVPELTLTEVNSKVPEQKASLVLRGQIDEYTQIGIDAQLQAFLPQPEHQIQASITELSLPELSPYLSDALAYNIESGQLDSNLKVKIQGDDLSGNAAIMLKSIDLTEIEQSGEKDSLDSGAISFNMALGMLKDSDGNVALDLPLSGDLHNPSVGLSGFFSLMMQRAIMLAAKDYLISTFLPYSQVIKIGLSVSGHVLKVSFSPLLYQPQQTEISPSQHQYVTQLAQVLKDKPHVKIKLCPVATLADSAAGEQPQVLLDLAKERGQKLKQYLTEQFQLASNRLFACAARLDRADKAQGRLEILQL